VKNLVRIRGLAARRGTNFRRDERNETGEKGFDAEEKINSQISLSRLSQEKERIEKEKQEESKTIMIKLKWKRDVNRAASRPPVAEECSLRGETVHGS